MDEMEMYRKIYLRTKVPASLQHQGWNFIRTQLAYHEKPASKKAWLPSLALASLAIFVALTGIAQAAVPGQLLYPVKLTTDNVLSRITNQPQIPIQNRANEVIEFSNKPDSQQLNQAVTQYQKSLQQAQTEASNAGQTVILKQSLQTQKLKLQQAVKNNPNSSQKLEPLIEQTEKIEGDVQGAHAQNVSGHGNNDSDRGENSNAHQNNPPLPNDRSNSNRDNH